MTTPLELVAWTEDLLADLELLADGIASEFHDAPSIMVPYWEARQQLASMLRAMRKAADANLPSAHP